ncbi:MAG TPA: hypothetical protein VG099_17395 [Gemmataceae bacterium]|jgi:hypothetical protein|nr:hypothetical protein [Gemmataceae bacterium]HEV3446422.1 hypothetical protein [Gemmataceae bacterium]
MNGRDYLTVARELAAGATEAHWRTAAGRAYYALMIECRDALRRWGFVPAARDNVHTFVRLRFTFATYPDLKKIGDALDRLVQWRNYGDYQLAVPGVFVSNTCANQAAGICQNALNMLDHIDQDPAIRAAAIATIQP